MNEDEIEHLMEWAHGLGMGLTLIEVMPLGNIAACQLDRFLPLSVVRARLSGRYTLDDLDEPGGDPRTPFGSRKRAGRSASSSR